MLLTWVIYVYTTNLNLLGLMHLDMGLNAYIKIGKLKIVGIGMDWTTACILGLVLLKINSWAGLQSDFFLSYSCIIVENWARHFLFYFGVVELNKYI